jgi:amidase
MSPSIQEIASQAQQVVLDAIPLQWKLPSNFQAPSNVLDVPKTCGLLTLEQVEITEQTASELLAKLSTKILSSVEVTEAFLARAAIAHQLVFHILLVQNSPAHNY